MKRWCKSCLALLLVVGASSLADAAPLSFGNDVDFAAEVAAELAAFGHEQESDLRQFRDERDREFTAFLAEQWSEFAVSPGLERASAPKPVAPPKARQASADEDIKPQGPVVEPTSPEPLPDSPPAPVRSADPERPLVAVDFYGLDLFLNYDPALQIAVKPPFDNRAIGAFWQKAAAADVAPLLERLGELRERFSLNDWAYFQLVGKVSEKIQGERHAATLGSWFLLLKSGYRVKVGYRDDGLYLLVPSDTPIYQVPFYTIDGTRFYHLSGSVVGEESGPVHTYRDDYPGAGMVLALDRPSPPATGGAMVGRSLSFDYAGERHVVEVRCRQKALEFYGGYPQTDFSVFFAGKVTAEAEASLMEALAPLVAGKTETEAVNLLLRFVQTAFRYRTDREQFGRERYLFAEETLSFDASDCEDRAVLFSWLVRRLTGLEVVGLHFPGHVATAVRFSAEVPGAAVEVGGRRYIVCDPTYINADIGMAMPQFNSGEAKIILFDS